MPNINFQIVQSNDHATFELIANWYLSEWKIPLDKSIQKLKAVSFDNSQFQILMYIDGIPVSTGGLYNHIGLLDKEPRLKVYQHWLALVYTTPEKRHQGYGALLCKYIQDYSKNVGVDSMYLFTDTAEQLYKRLGWIELERLSMDNRNIVIMKKDLL